MNPKHAQHFEAIKYSLRQSKDGVVVAFVVQPEDVRPELMALPVGARIMVAWSAIGDDERPVAASSNGKTPDFDSGKVGSTPTAAAKPKRKFSDLSLPEQAGIRCDDGRFERFLHDMLPDGFVTAEDAVRALCGIASRRELSTNHAAANKWREIEREYQQWLTDETHGASVNR